MKEVISASRRTDMPAHYLDRLTGFIKQGFADVRNPYSGKTSTVSLRPEDVHTIVLWSKNFGNFLEKSLFPNVSNIFKDFNLYFLFTINDMPYLETGIPSLEDRLDQLNELAERFGPERIAWRYDPVIFNSNGPVSGAETFRRIGERIADSGVSRTIFSFLDIYGKIKKRDKELKLNLIDPPVENKIEYSSRIAGISRELGLTLESCCDDIGDVGGITASSCINGNLLSALAGVPARLRKDSGQRKSCTCTVSRDIGSYSEMPCPGGCMYCYANPVFETHEGVSL
ncbi:DUF1848 family protein [Candidatus Latescibacterota bacterium]